MFVQNWDLNVYSTAYLQFPYHSDYITMQKREDLAMNAEILIVLKIKRERPFQQITDLILSYGKGFCSAEQDKKGKFIWILLTKSLCHEINYLKLFFISNIEGIPWKAGWVLLAIRKYFEILLILFMTVMMVSILENEYSESEKSSFFNFLNRVESVVFPLFWCVGLVLKWLISWFNTL